MRFSSWPALSVATSPRPARRNALPTRDPLAGSHGATGRGPHRMCVTNPLYDNGCGSFQGTGQAAVEMTLSRSRELCTRWRSSDRWYDQ